MASIKDSFAKGLTTLNVKTNNFMEETKCKTYISTLEEEIRKAKTSLGELYYENRENVSAVTSKLDEICAEITAKYEEIKVQEEKIRNLAETEQQILGTTAAPAAAPAAEGGPSVFCSQCGAPNSAHYKFCCKCGSSLSQ